MLRIDHHLLGLPRPRPGHLDSERRLLSPYQSVTPVRPLDLFRHEHPVNPRSVVFKMHHVVELDCGTFGLGKWTGSTGLEGVTAVEMPLQRILSRVSMGGGSSSRGAYRSLRVGN